LVGLRGPVGREIGSWSTRDCRPLALGLKYDSSTVPQGTGVHFREES